MKKQAIYLALVSLILGLTGCESSKEKAGRLLLETLEARYDESFAISSIGNSWGTADDSTIKAFVYPQSHPDQVFRATIKKDFSEVKDLYLPILMSEDLTEAVRSIVPNTFDSLIYTYIASGLTVEGLSAPTLSEYFSQNEEAEVAIQLFLKLEDPSWFNQQQEAEAILDFTSRYLAKGYTLDNLLVYYLKPEAFEALLVDDSGVSDNFARYADELYSYQWLRLKPTHFEVGLTAESVKQAFNN